MRLSCLSLLSLLLFSIAPSLIAQTENLSAISDYLQECCAQQIPEDDRLLDLLYDEVERKPYHSRAPWTTREIVREGRAVVGADLFLQYDTVSTPGRAYASIRQYSGGLLFRRNYEGKEMTQVSPADLVVEPLLNARYSPISLLEKTRQASPRSDLITRPGYALYRMRIDAEEVTLEIGRSDRLLKRVVRRWYDEMLGDLCETIVYEEFEDVDGVSCPRLIVTDRGHGLRDTIKVIGAKSLREVPLPLVRPEEYEVRPPVPVDSGVVVEKISKNIHGIRFLHTESQSFLVEFSDFFAVIDVPFNSSNGETVLREAEKIAPDKPVRIVAFGHHHPWYIGGVRPFVHRGATVLARSENIEYVRSLVNASHAMQPDSLQLSPQPLRTEMIDTIMSITDGDYAMQVIHIGMRSAHTEDYLLFYFPLEKMVVHGDLAWIRMDGEISPASVRERGLYQAILDFGLDVETILQTWPTSERHDVKVRYPMSALEEKVEAGDDLP